MIDSLYEATLIATVFICLSAFVPTCCLVSTYISNNMNIVPLSISHIRLAVFQFSAPSRLLGALTIDCVLQSWPERLRSRRNLSELTTATLQVSERPSA